MDDRLDDSLASTNININSARAGLEEPQGELEQAIAKLWEELFQRGKVGRHDNFFELGGNSLLGMDLSEMFSARLGLEVPVLSIFQHPTVAEIAGNIDC